MKQFLITATVLVLLLFSGCNGSVEHEYFDGIIYTYAKPPDQNQYSEGVYNGPGYQVNPNDYFRADSFWDHYSILNSSLSDLEINDLRQHFSITSTKVFLQDNDYIAAWSVRIEEGNFATFNAICQTYRMYRRALHSGSIEPSKFLSDRAQSIRDDLSEATQISAEAPNLERDQNVQILQANLTQIENRIREIAAEQEQEYTGLPGFIVEHLMANPPATSATANVK